MDCVVEAYNFYHTVVSFERFLLVLLIPSGLMVLLAYRWYCREECLDAFGLLAVSFLPLFAIFTFYFWLPDSEHLQTVVEKQIALVNKNELKCDEQVLLANIISSLPTQSVTTYTTNEHSN